MTWVKIDDHFPDHPKLLKLGDDYDACVSLHVRGLCYCAANLTDGFIPTRIFRGDERLAGRLVDIGLWETCAGGHRVHDYLDYNPSCAEVTTQREELSAARSAAGKLGAAARWDGKHGKGYGKTHGNGDGISNGPVPVPVPKPEPCSPSPDIDPVSEGVSGSPRTGRGSYPQDDPTRALLDYAERLGRDLHAKVYGLTANESASVKRWVRLIGTDEVCVQLGYASQDGYITKPKRIGGAVKASAARSAS